MTEEYDEQVDVVEEDEVDEFTGFAEDVKLFGKWSTEEISHSRVELEDFLKCKRRFAVYVPHTAGRYQIKRFRKTLCPIVERLVNSLMMHGRNNGKKLMAIRIVRHCFELIHLQTGKNPVQVFVQAVENCGPREDSTRIVSAGVVRRQAVDVSPLRRVNQAIYLLSARAQLLLPQHEEHGRVPRGRDHERREGEQQLVRDQEEGRDRARGQGQPVERRQA